MSTRMLQAVSCSTARVSCQYVAGHKWGQLPGSEPEVPSLERREVLMCVGVGGPASAVGPKFSCFLKRVVTSVSL